MKERFSKLADAIEEIIIKVEEEILKEKDQLGLVPKHALTDVSYNNRTKPKTYITSTSSNASDIR